LHPVLGFQTKPTGQVRSAREKFAGAGAKVLPPLYSDWHRIESTDSDDCHAAKKRKKLIEIADHRNR